MGRGLTDFPVINDRRGEFSFPILDGLGARSCNQHMGERTLMNLPSDDVQEEILWEDLGQRDKSQTPAHRRSLKAKRKNEQQVTEEPQEIDCNFKSMRDVAAHVENVLLAKREIYEAQGNLTLWAELYNKHKSTTFKCDQKALGMNVTENALSTQVVEHANEKELKATPLRNSYYYSNNTEHQRHKEMLTGGECHDIPVLSRTTTCSSYHAYDSY